MCATQSAGKEINSEKDHPERQQLASSLLQISKLKLFVWVCISFWVCVCFSTWKGSIFTTAIIYSTKNKLYLLGKNILNKYFLFCFFSNWKSAQVHTFSRYSFDIKEKREINQRAAELNPVRVLCLSLSQKLHLLLCRLCNQWIPLMDHFYEKNHTMSIMLHDNKKNIDTYTDQA